MITEKERTPGHSMSALPPAPLASPLSSSGATGEQLAQESPDPLNPSTNHSSFLSLDPPITQAVLSEIDVQRVKSDLLLRHRLNFDPQIQFRISTQGPQVEKKRERAREYWNALAQEIAWWLAHCQRIASSPSSRPLRISLPKSGAKSSPQGRSPRLPRLFGAVRDMLKHWLPSEEWYVHFRANSFYLFANWGPYSIFAEQKAPLLPHDCVVTWMRFHHLCPVSRLVTKT